MIDMYSTRSLGHHLVCLALLIQTAAILVGCGGGKTDGAPTFNATAVNISAEVGYGKRNTFLISGSNLRSAVFGVFSGCSDRPVIQARTNSQVSIQCTADNTSVTFSVVDGRTAQFLGFIEGNAKSSLEPNITDFVAKAVGTVAFLNESTFVFTGTNLQRATVSAASGCGNDFKIVEQTDTSIRFSCTPNALNINLDVFESHNLSIGVVQATVPDPNFLYALSDVVGTSNAKLGAVSKFDLSGNNLYGGLVNILAEGCLGTKIIYSTDGTLAIDQIECKPINASPTFKLVSASDPTKVLSTIKANFSDLPKAPLTIQAQNVSAIDGNANTFTVTGYFAEAVAPTVSASGCNSLKLGSFNSTNYSFSFSCIPERLDASFVLKNSASQTIADLSLPIQVLIGLARGNNLLAEYALRVNLDYRKAPITVANFLAYVRGSYFANTLIHRIETQEINGQFSIIQGGAYTSIENLKTDTSKPGQLQPIVLESPTQTGLSNTRGTIGMARTSDINSATSQFYFNVTDNSNVFDGNSLTSGYAVFGAVADEESLNQLDILNQLPTNEGSTVPQEEVHIVNVFRTM